MQTLEFLLEIGVEEIPDWMIPGAIDSLRKRFEEALGKAGLGDGVSVRAEAAARRLVLLADGLAAQQADQTETLSGPPANIAYDDEGNLTKAGQGFAKRAGVEPAAIAIGADGKLKVERTIVGRPTREILAEALPEVILGVYFPKNMTWTGKGGPRFIRPIRWLLALLGGEVVNFEIAGVKAGRVTYGHRRLSKGALEVGSIADYEAKLAEGFVVLSAEERRRRIVEGSRAALPSGAGLTVRDNPKLLETLTYLTEYPTVIYGEFEQRYLALPDEVLETVMLVHQKYFAVADAATGKLVNAFLAVANLDGDPDGEIRRGAMRVLRARFNDAEFFWNADLDKSLASRVEDLKKVTFQAQLGSYWDKTQRMRKLAAALAEAADLDASAAQQADQAAELSKADLTTGMVGEFPELQGVMGGLYAAAQGETAAVSDAVYDHYKPVSPADSIPRAREGRVVAIADKLDTLGGLFRLGMLPTGSRDPFALRRSAYGIIRILIEGEMRVTIDELIGMAEAGEHAGALREFLVERLRHFLTEKGFKYDEINAVLAADDREPLDASLRAAAIAQVRPTADFEPLAVSFKRVRNILEKAGGVETYAAKRIDESLLDRGAERDLFDGFQTVRRNAEAARDRGDYRGALESIATLRPALDRFFDDVLVMAKDEAVRENRLTFLATLLRQLSTIADFAEIVSGE